MTNNTFEFPCGRWLSESEDDGQISRDLVLAGDHENFVPGMENEFYSRSLNLRINIKDLGTLMLFTIHVIVGVTKTIEKPVFSILNFSLLIVHYSSSQSLMFVYPDKGIVFSKTIMLNCVV